MAPKKITKLIRLTSAKTITRTSKYIVKKEKRKGEFLGIRPHVLFKFFFFFHKNIEASVPHNML